MAGVDVATPPKPVDWDSTAAAEKEITGGLLKFLQPVVKQCDERLQSLLQSQSALSKQVDAFAAEVAKFHNEQKDGLHLATYTAKLTASRKKLKKVEMMVMQTKDRIENINRMHNQLLTNEAAFRERVEAQAKGAGEQAGKTETKEEKEDGAAAKPEEVPADAKADEDAKKE